MENCGFMIFDVGMEDMPKIMDDWAYEGPLSCPVNGIYDSLYAVFRSNQRVVAVVNVDRWIRVPGDNAWRFEFSSAAYAAGQPLPEVSNFTGSKWGVVSQVAELDPALNNPNLEHHKPSPPPLKLGMEDATQALALNFGVCAEKVKIQIHN